MKKPIVVRVFKGEVLQGVKQILDSQVVIGSQSEAQVSLQGDKVSVIHAVIEERDSGYFVCDLGSESGTLLNGEVVLDSPIESGDILQVGEFRLEFYIGVPKPKVPPPGAKPVQTVVPEVAASVVANSGSTSNPPKLVEPKNEPLFEPVTVPPKSAAELNLNKAEIKKESERKTVASLKVQSVDKSVPLSQESPVELGAGPVGVSSVKEVKSKGSLGRKKLTKKKKSKTFAPASRFERVTDYVKPSKGTTVEVLVAWRERVIACHHFSGKTTVTMGSHPDCDIVLPAFVSRTRKVPILQIQSQAVIFINPEMRGELVRAQGSSNFVELLRQNRMVKSGSVYSLKLDQGELIRLELNEQISIVIRYVSDAPKPLVAPILDLTASEFTGVVLSAVLVAVLGLYMYLYSPPHPLEGEDAVNEPEIMARIIVARPTPPPMPPPVDPVPPAPPVPPPPPPVVKATPSPKKVEVVAKAEAAKPTVTNVTNKVDAGKSANAAPNDSKSTSRRLTSPKQGGAIKVSDKPAAQMQSQPKRDVTKSGVFSAFGGGGAQDELSQHTSGAGELAGFANAASGKAGAHENRAGQGLGSALKDTGQGGTGKAFDGVAGGMGDTLRGTGNTGYGTGGLGTRSGVKIVTGGSGEVIPGTIDREAIRRVIRENLKAIRTCYERQLNRFPDLTGKIVLKWDIGEQGRVLSVGTQSNELGNNEVAQCVMEKLKTWRFPTPPNNQVVEVAYPFIFSN